MLQSPSDSVSQHSVSQRAAPDVERHAESRRLIWLSLCAAIVTLGLKFAAYAVTNSVGLLSDAVESSANVLAALTALGAIWYSSRPADRDHPYGHEKIEFFSGGIEGGLILFASLTIAFTAVVRLNAPQETQSLGLGAALAMVATVINAVVGLALLRAGKRLDSIVLEADGHHLLTDVWTSLGVVIGLILVKITGWNWLDPVLAMLIALNIARIGVSLLKRSFDGLMDRALNEDEISLIRQNIEMQLQEGETYHALRTRRAGSRRFIDYHLLLPGQMPLQFAHDREMQIGDAIIKAVPGIEITAHIEPIEEPLAWNDAQVE